MSRFGGKLLLVSSVGALLALASPGSVGARGLRGDEPAQGETAYEELEQVSRRLEAGRRTFEASIAAPRESLDLPGALGAWDDELVALRWMLDRILEADVAPRDGALLLLVESTGEELRLARDRMSEVESAGAELVALAQLQGDVEAALAADQPRRARQLLGRRLAEPLDPLAWPSFLRARLRKLERSGDAAAVALRDEPLPNIRPR